MKKILAFIPARAGSKGIPGKNLAVLGGKPLIQYSIEVAKGCSLIDQLFVSTDSKKILDAAQVCGADRYDYLRPEELSGDSSLTVDAALHALEWLELRGEHYDIIILLQPTSPLRSTKDLFGAVQQFLDTSEAKTLVSVHKMREHPYECLQGKAGKWKWLAESDMFVCGRQAYPDDFYFVNGAVYIATTDFLKRERSFFHDGKSLLYVMPQENGVDIDEPEDLRFAEWLLAGKNKKE